MHSTSPPTNADQAIEAAVFRRLLQHLDDNKQVQNIDLMELAGFCRNCLAKWYVAAAEERDVAVDYEAARERVYGMPYGEWKLQHQTGEHVRLGSEDARQGRPGPSEGPQEPARS